MENINKIICQNISKQLCKLWTAADRKSMSGAFDSHKRRRVRTEAEALVRVPVSTKSFGGPASTIGFTGRIMRVVQNSKLLCRM